MSANCSRGWNDCQAQELVNEIRASSLRSPSYRRPPLPPPEVSRNESLLIERELVYIVNTSFSTSYPLLPPPPVSFSPLSPAPLSSPGTPPESPLLSQVTREIDTLQGEAFPEETRSIPDTVSSFDSIDNDSELPSDSLDRYSYFYTVCIRCSTCSFRHSSADITIPLQ